MSQEQLVNSFLSLLGATKQPTSLKFLISKLQKNNLLLNKLSNRLF